MLSGVDDTVLYSTHLGDIGDCNHIFVRVKDRCAIRGCVWEKIAVVEDVVAAGPSDVRVIGVRELGGCDDATQQSIVIRVDGEKE